MITIIPQQMILLSLKFRTDLLQNRLDCSGRMVGIPLRNADAMRSSGGKLEGSCVVDACRVGFVVASKGIFSRVEDYAGMEEGTAEGPEEGGESAGLFGERWKGLVWPSLLFIVGGGKGGMERCVQVEGRRR